MKGRLVAGHEEQVVKTFQNSTDFECCKQIIGLKNFKEFIRCRQFSDVVINMPVVK